MWKKGLFSWEFRNVVWDSRDATRKAKVLLKLNLAKEVKDNKKDFFRYVKGRLEKMWVPY